MDGILLVGHGSLRAGSAQAMEAVAGVLRAQHATLHVAPCFLNYGSPTVFEAAADLLSRGVSQIMVQPYFLVPGQYVLQDLPAQVYRLGVEHPTAHFHIAPVMGDHDRILDMLCRKVEEHVTAHGHTPDTCILIAHGSPYPEANRQVRRLVRHLQPKVDVPDMQVAFLDLEAPDLASCCQAVLDAGRRRIAVMPFFLHAGRHVMEDLPRILHTVSTSAPPDSELVLTTPLDDIEALAAIVFDQCVACRPQSWGTALAAQQNQQPPASPFFLHQATTSHGRQSLFGRGGDREVPI